jgi:hypothetical protein
VNIDGSSPQLYHLSADPSESRNLTEEHPGRVARLDKLLRAWNAALPVDGTDPAFQKPASLKKGSR